MLRLCIILICVGGLLNSAANCPAEEAAPRELRTAIRQAVTLLEAGSAGSADQRVCFTCHSQGLPVLAVAAARARGFEIDEENLKRQIQHTADFLETGKDRYESGKGQGGKADTAGYALWTLEAGDYQADEITGAVADFLLDYQSDSGHWRRSSSRPPSEASNFTTTYVALLGLKVWGPEDRAEAIAARTAEVKKWLLATKPQDTEDAVFRLRALRYLATDEEAITAAETDLLDRRNSDGGWPQLAEGASDAYATGSALVALYETHADPGSVKAFREGVAWLRADQQEDGSWLVKSRSKPFQTYYETGFPHGKDQFISTAATAWATMALLLAVE